MKNFKMCLVMALGLITGMTVVTYADNGMNGMQMTDNPMKADNTKPPVAISGYCPVCVLSGMLNKGSDNFVTEYKGKLYKFEGMDEQKEFLENPEMFTKDLDEKFQKLGGK